MNFRSIRRFPIGTLDLDQIGIEHEHHDVDLVAQRLSVAFEYFLFQRTTVPQTRLADLKLAALRDRTIAIQVVPIYDDVERGRDGAEGDWSTGIPFTFSAKKLLGCVTFSIWNVEIPLARLPIFT